MPPIKVIAAGCRPSSGSVQQQYAGQHLRGEIEQRHQGEEPQRAIGRKVCPKGLVRPFGLPAQ